MNGRDPERQALLPPPNTRQDTDVQHQAVDSVLARQELRPRDPPLWGLGAVCNLSLPQLQALIQLHFRYLYLYVYMSKSM
jgi:hypothetical protein